MREATERLTAKELEEYKDIFSFFDRDGGGSITSVELGQVERFYSWLDIIIIVACRL